MGHSTKQKNRRMKMLAEIKGNEWWQKAIKVKSTLDTSYKKRDCIKCQINIKSYYFLMHRNLKLI